MEFFIPSLFLFLIAVVVSFMIIPKFTPMVIAVLSIALLTFGVYHHYKIFSSEYRLSTWQDSLKIYAPAIMIGALILFIIFSMLSFFARGSVPVPNAPIVEMPTAASATNAVTSTINSVAESIGNAVTNVTNVITGNNTKANANKGGIMNSLMGNRNKNRGNVSRSLFEIL